jgi:hypothetical protein
MNLAEIEEKVEGSSRGERGGDLHTKELLPSERDEGASSAAAGGADDCRSVERFSMALIRALSSSSRADRERTATRPLLLERDITLQTVVSLRARKTGAESFVHYLF